MSKDNGSNMNRRNVLKKLGVSSIALAGIPVVTSAEDYDPEDNEIQDLLEKPQVQNLESAVGGFKVIGAEKKNVEGDSYQLEAFKIETDVGNIIYANPETDDAEAQLQFADLTEKPELRSRLPKSYRNVPTETDIVLTGGSNVHMVRTVTEAEYDALAEKTGYDKLGQVVYNSASHEYELTVRDEESDQVQEFIVDAGSNESNPEPTGAAQSPITTQGGCASSECASCALWAASRGLCYASCAAAQLYACIACLAVNTTSLAFADCDTCANQCL